MAVGKEAELGFKVLSQPCGGGRELEGEAARSLVALSTAEHLHTHTHTHDLYYI